MILLPRLYAILDASFHTDVDSLLAFARELMDGGCTLLHYRNMSGKARAMLEQASRYRRVVSQDQSPHFSQKQGEAGHPHTNPGSIRLIMNDRADLCLAADFDGVHVGQDDLSAESVRAIIGSDRWLGVSTHNPDQLRDADLTS